MPTTYPRCFTKAQRAVLAPWNEDFPLGLRIEVSRLKTDDGVVVDLAVVWDRCGDGIYSMEPGASDAAQDAVWLDGCGPRKQVPSVAAAMAVILEHERAHLAGRQGLLRAGATL